MIYKTLSPFASPCPCPSSSIKFNPIDTDYGPLCNVPSCCSLLGPTDTKHLNVMSFIKRPFHDFCTNQEWPLFRQSVSHNSCCSTINERRQFVLPPIMDLLPAATAWKLAVGGVAIEQFRVNHRESTTSGVEKTRVRNQRNTRSLIEKWFRRRNTFISITIHDQRSRRWC